VETRIKVIHIPFSFPPDPVGGTEVYVAQLAKDLNSLGIESIVAAPAKDSARYSIDGLEVRRFAFSQEIKDPAELYGLGDEKAASAFAQILDEEKPNLVHLHALTFAISVRLLRAATERAIPVILTYHTPTVSCQRGTMLLWGRYFCDGRLEVVRCSSCTLNGLGMNEPVARLIGHFPPKIGDTLRAAGFRGGAWTALRTTELMKSRHDAFRTMVSEVSSIVAVCGWVRDVLIKNEVPRAKIVLSRHGINLSRTLSTRREAEKKTSDVENLTQIVFVGRLERVKGLHILIGAVRLNLDLNITLDIFGIVQNESQLSYRNELVTLIGDDTRISFNDPIPSSEVVDRLSKYDLLAIPSQWIETGPLVALEAFAAGIPVMGWNIGGVSELVTHEVDGLLIEPGSDGVERWAETLRHVATDRSLRERLKAGVRPPRKSADVAQEMSELYKNVLLRVVSK
jgi:glycosyltransferase involved in cell wall biosynthesis